MNAKRNIPAFADPAPPPEALAAVVDWLQAEASGWDAAERLQDLCGRLAPAIGVDHAFIARVHEAFSPPPATQIIAGAVRKPPGYRPEEGAELAIACFADEFARLQSGMLLDTGCDPIQPAGNPLPFGAVLAPVRAGGALWGMIGLTDGARSAILSPGAREAMDSIAALLGDRLRPAAAAGARSADKVLTAALDLVSEPFSVYDGCLRVVRYNRAWRKMLSHVRPGEDLHGIALLEIYRAHVDRGLWTPEYADAMFRDLASGKYEMNRERIAHVGGRYKRTRVYGMPGGGFVSVHNDVNELVERHRELAAAKEEAELASRAKSTFLANVSHELRTPLNAIIGFSDVMVREILGPLPVGHYREYAQDIHDSGNLLLSLINDILDMARIEAGKFELHPEPISLDSLLRDVLRMIELRAKSKGLSLDVRAAADLPALLGDRRATTQILMNLIGNAIKFTPKGGMVTVDAQQRGSDVVVAVIDTGPGIDRALLARLGRPFEQADDVEIDVTRENKGTGLGLAISRALAERQGGHLSIQSEPGQGTTVAFTIPVAGREHG
ncbi:MAG: ATP-binding protein [Alphaproteobacteria bacterium]|nr:ATP-binding protein [Alphaproteobacteria bacterium]